jgi:hypothetical protein
MRPILTQAQTLETLRMAQHLAPLLGQRDALTRDLVWSRHADSQPLLGLLWGRRPTPGRPSPGDASRILRLAHPMVFGPPKERFDRVGAERQANVIEPKRLGDGKVVRKRGAQLEAQSG